MAKKFKTSKQKREGYTYYFADGTRKTVQLTDLNVTETNIALNHEMDDVEIDAARRSEYHMPTRTFSDYEKQTFLFEVPDEQPTPEEVLVFQLEEIERQEKLMYAHEVLETFTAIQKRTFHLHYIEGLSLREIARQEEKDFSTVKECIQGIDKKIKKYLKKHPLT